MSHLRRTKTTTLSSDDWRLFVHPLIDDQLERLTVAAHRWQMKNAGKPPGSIAKRLHRIDRLVREEIPQGPGHAKYRLGGTIGSANTVWFRAKFFGQHRLFFRFDSAAKIIVYVWVNDEASLRAYGSKTDAYALFKKMLDSGYPPGSFEELLKQSREI